MDSEDAGPLLYILGVEARLTCKEGFRDNREKALLAGQTMNVKTVNVLLASSGKDVFNLEGTHHQEIIQERLACRNQTEH